MKWQARSKYTRKDLKWRRDKFKEHWHSAFAWLPKRIPETKHDEIIVPCHYVWLEAYETRHYGADPEFRPYTGRPTLEEMVRAP